MSMYKSFTVASLLTAAFISTPSFADVALDDDGKVNLFGDLRIRAEADDSEREGQADRDRERMRYRARLGVKFAVVDNWSGKIRVATNTDGLNSPHADFNTSENGSDIGFDQAYVAYTGYKNLTLIAGKTALNFANSTEVFWDADINPDALAATYKAGKFTFNTAYTTITEGSWEDDVDALLAQGVYSTKFDKSKLTLALGGATVESDNLYNGETYMMVMADWGFNKMRFIAEYIDSDADVEDIAYTLQARYSFGNGWGVRAYVLHVEAFSTIGDGTFSQDDFPNPGSTGVSNYDGYRLQLDYKVNSNVAVDLRLFTMERIEDKATLPMTASDAIFNEDDRSRLQANLNYKF